MAHTKVLLREDVDDLGARGEIVRVRSGYARNYLLPRSLAVAASTVATALSLPIDVCLGRYAANRSWHAVFVLERKDHAY